MVNIDNNLRIKLQARGICVIIPTYNNDTTIKSVIEDCLCYCSDVIVVNDGSTDNTKAILANIDGIIVVDYAKNKGKGYALKRGFLKAKSLGFSYAITIDSDGQHFPSDIITFLHANQEHPGSLIIGERNLTGVDRSSGSDFANKFSNFWFFVQTGKKLSDTQTGYRLYPLKKLYGLLLLTSRYEAELELLVSASWHGINIVPIPINVYYPPRAERVSHFRPFADFMRISLLNTILCVLAVLYGLPLRLWRWLSKYLRTVFAIVFCIVVIMFIISPIIWIYSKIGKFDEHKRLTIHKIINRFARLLMFNIGIPGTRFSYSNLTGEDFVKPSVIICNHQSHLDLMCQLIFTPKMVFLTNNWVWNNPIYGLIIRNAEFYPVAEGVETLMPKLKDLVNRGYHIAIYPEGTRSPDCKILRFHKGAFLVAKELNIDILPMYLYGPGKVLPKNKHTLSKGPIHIEVGARFSPTQLSELGDIRKQASYMRHHYENAYEQLCDKIEQDV